MYPAITAQEAFQTHRNRADAAAWRLAARQEEVVLKTVALERLVPVHHAALEEFDSESRRHQEMSTRKLDLEKSLGRILETIRTIGLTSSERFTSALVAINASIDRFTALLEELSDETQFVLITHSRRTMETARALYGVTQEEPGVSEIVGVRFS